MKDNDTDVTALSRGDQTPQSGSYVLVSQARKGDTLPFDESVRK
jgi:hypothetical protein